MTPRLLNRSDIPQAMRLKDAAGWNQTAEDWARLLDLAPDGCFGIDVDGVLASTTTAVCYGTHLAWIGMVLTWPEYRGHGFARTLMQHALEYIEGRGIACIKLDATDMGRPLYEQLGFGTESLIERWWRAPSVAEGSPTLQAREINAALDRFAFGADRLHLLHELAQTECVSMDGGYAMMRPGSDAAYLGPCVAASPDIAGELIAALLARRNGEPIYWDVLPENGAAVELAKRNGFVPRRRLARMVRGKRLDCRNDLVYCIAGFEWG